VVPGATAWLVVDDQPLFDALTAMLEGLSLRAVPFRSARELTEEASLDGHGCLLVDAGARGAGAEEVRRCLATLGPRPPLILLVDDDSMRTAAYGMKDGAFDLLEKPVDPGRMAAVLRAALTHDRDVIAIQARHDEHLDRLRSLTPREFQVMRLVVEGKSNKKAAQALEISVKTVEVHRANVMEKMGVHSVPELVRLVLQCDSQGSLLDEQDRDAIN
jgi:FixJ family two-component response regulator